jgi:hypothetical protein
MGSKISFPERRGCGQKKGSHAERERNQGRVRMEKKGARKVRRKRLLRRGEEEGREATGR